VGGGGGGVFAMFVLCGGALCVAVGCRWHSAVAESLPDPQAGAPSCSGAHRVHQSEGCVSLFDVGGNRTVSCSDAAATTHTRHFGLTFLLSCSASGVVTIPPPNHVHVLVAWLHGCVHACVSCCPLLCAWRCRSRCHPVRGLGHSCGRVSRKR